MQQGPFKLSEEMLKDIDADIAEVAGIRPSSISLRRRHTVVDSESIASAPEDNPASTENLLAERHQTHGNYEDNAIVSQALKEMFRSGPGWNRLTAIEKESMDMIALKFSRILSGRSMEKQHWEDVVGYAKLVEEKCF